MNVLFDATQLLGAAFIGGLFFAAGLGLSWIVRRLFATAIRRAHSDSLTLIFLRHLAVLAVWLVLITFYAHLVPVLNKLGTALLAGVSLLSIAIGFAAQTTLGNLVAGVGLIIYRPFGRGDRVQIAAPTKDSFVVGVVEDISLGYTKLRTDDGRQIVIANGTMAQQTLIKLPLTPTA